MPNHRKLLAAAALVAGLIAAGSPALAQTTFKIATLSPTGSSWLKTMKAAGDDIAKQTDGRVKLRFYPGGVMGSDHIVLQKMRFGQLQGSTLLIGSMADIYPDMDLYGTYFKFASEDELDAVRQSLDPMLIKGLADRGYVSFGMADGGMAYILSNKPIGKPDDLRGLKIWAPSDDAISARLFSQLGLNPVPLGIGDVLTGLQTGLVDVAANSPIGTIALQWHTAVKDMTLYPVAATVATLVVNKKDFDKLSPADQSAMRTALDKAFKEMDVENKKENEAAMAALKNQGLTFIKPTAAEVALWQDMGAKVSKASVALSHFTPALMQQMDSLLKTYRAKGKHASAN